jgi:hypothetical protein
VYGAGYLIPFQFRVQVLLHEAHGPPQFLAPRPWFSLRGARALRGILSWARGGRMDKFLGSIVLSAALR